MNDQMESAQARILVLNALRDVVSPEEPSVLDPESRAVVRASFETLTGDRQTAFAESIDDFSEVGPGEHATGSPTLETVVDEVLRDLVDRGVVATVDHEAVVRLPRRHCLLYNFSRAPDESVVPDLSLPTGVEEHTVEGAKDAARGDYTGAIDHFEDALEACPSPETEVPIRILLGWVCFWCGDRLRAMDMAKVAIQLQEEETWDAKLLWMAATHEKADLIADGDLHVGAILRWVGSVPSEGGSIDVSVEIPSAGFSERLEGLREAPLSIPLDRLAPEIDLTFRLHGQLPQFPLLNAYYVGIGSMDPNTDEVEIERILYSGPETADAVETLT
ncbi:MAG: hypothetical protein R3324_12555, partial [Halobacteriales archaeon]|nr:hypothetical protein [Halobacteriales archaeon]